MSGISSERIEPASPVVEPQESEPRREPGPGGRRRKAPTPEEREFADSQELPPHQVDRLA